jgi:hypothetical protein
MNDNDTTWRTLGSVTAGLVERLREGRAAKAGGMALAARISGTASGDRASDGENVEEAVPVRTCGPRR